jgi:hypothetical protein
LIYGRDFSKLIERPFAGIRNAGAYKHERVVIPQITQLPAHLRFQKSASSRAGGGGLPGRPL